MSTAPTFLVGAERSGSTMLRLMLDRHSRIAWLNEFEYAVDRVSDDGRTPSTTEYVDWLSQHRVFRASGLSIPVGETYAELVEGFLEQHRRRCNKVLVGATVHRHFDRLLHFWPNARFVHIVRDPRDVAASCIGMGWAGNVYCGVSRWIAAERLWQRVAASLSNDRSLTVQYESLVERPDDELSRVCRFLGVEYEPGMPSIHESSTYEAPDPKYARQWKRSMISRDIQRVEARVGALLQHTGYESSGLARWRVSAIERAALALQDRVARWTFRIRRYGFGLWVSDFFARHLRVRRWSDSTRQRINAITTAHLK